MAHTALKVTFVVPAATNVSSTTVWVVETTLVGSEAPEPTPSMPPLTFAGRSDQAGGLQLPADDLAALRLGHRDGLHAPVADDVDEAPLPPDRPALLHLRAWPDAARLVAACGGADQRDVSASRQGRR